MRGVQKFYSSSLELQLRSGRPSAPRSSRRTKRFWSLALALAPPRPAPNHVFSLVFVFEKFESTELQNILPEKRSGTIRQIFVVIHQIFEALLADGGAVGRSVLFGGMGPPKCSTNNDAGDQALT